MRISPTDALAVFTGVAVGTLLWLVNYWFGSWAVPTNTPVWPSWFAGVQSLIEAVASVAPGFIAGWLAKARGLVLGAAVAVMLSFVSLCLVLAVWGVMSPLEVAHFVIFTAILNLITQPLAGVAAVALAHDRVAL